MALGLKPATEKEVREATRECRDDIYADNKAHDCPVRDPFVNFVIVGNVVVFTFFTDPFEIYAFTCNERALISEFEGSGLAMTDIDEHRELLACNYGKSRPDILVSLSVAEKWMDLQS